MRDAQYCLLLTDGHHRRSTGVLRATVQLLVPVDVGHVYAVDRLFNRWYLETISCLSSIYEYVFLHTLNH